MYIRKDCENGVLTDNNDINYYKATQRDEIISNYMLGDYNQDGEYILDDNIINELVAMPKCVINSFSNLVFCESLVVTEFIEKEKFLVKTVQHPNNVNIKISTLEVMESVNKVEGCIINTVSTVLAQFIDKDSPEYVNKMYEAFNIIDAEEFSQEQAEKYSRGYVSLRRKYIYSINQLCLKNMNQASKQAYLDKIQILKASGIVGEETLKLFEERLKKNPLIASHNDYKSLNELLDSAIEVHKEQLEPIMPQIRQVGETYAQKIEEIENHANLNLKTMQKSYGASATITTQQAIVEKNKSQNQNNIIKIISQQAKETTAEKSQSNQQEIIIEQKPEKNNILKNFFGSVIANQKQPKQEKTENKKEDKAQDKKEVKDAKKTEPKVVKKEEKKTETKTDKKPEQKQATTEKSSVSTAVPKPQTKKQEQSKPKEEQKKEEKSSQPTFNQKQENTYKPTKQENSKPKIEKTNNKEKPEQTGKTTASKTFTQSTKTAKPVQPKVNKQDAKQEAEKNSNLEVNALKNTFGLENILNITPDKSNVVNSVQEEVNNKDNPELQNIVKEDIQVKVKEQENSSLFTNINIPNSAPNIGIDSVNAEINNAFNEKKEQVKNKNDEMESSL